MSWLAAQNVTTTCTNRVRKKVPAGLDGCGRSPPRIKNGCVALRLSLLKPLLGETRQAGKPVPRSQGDRQGVLVTFVPCKIVEPREHGLPVCGSWCRSFSVIPSEVEGSPRSDSFCCTESGKSLRVDPSTTRQKNAASVGMTKKMLWPDRTAACQAARQAQSANTRLRVSSKNRVPKIHFFCW
jgi:hypothetical protein